MGTDRNVEGGQSPVPGLSASSEQPGERVLAHARAIFFSAVRLVIKNKMIVGALEHHLDYDPEYFASVAVGSLLGFAAETETRRAQLRAGTFEALRDAEEQHRTIERRRRERLDSFYSHLSHRLILAAGDPKTVALLVDEARIAAWHEVSDAWNKQLLRPTDYVVDTRYAREREGRIQELVFIDLVGLLQTQGLDMR